MGISSGVFKRAEYIPDRWDFKRDFQGAKEGVLGYNDGNNLMQSTKPDQLFGNTLRIYPKENPTLTLDGDTLVALGIHSTQSLIRSSLFVLPNLYEQAIRASITEIPENDVIFLMKVHSLIRKSFAGRRRSGESSASHPIGVSLILAGELKEQNPRTIAYGLLHDYVEDILWSDIYLKQCGHPELTSDKKGKDSELHAKRVAFAVDELRNLGTTHGIDLDENDIAIIMALSIDKTHGEHYRNQIALLKAACVPSGVPSGQLPRVKKMTAALMKDAASRVRIADKIANLRSGEADLSTSPKAQKRLLKQAIGGYAHVVPLLQHIKNPEEQRVLSTALLNAIRTAVQTITLLARRDNVWWPDFGLSSPDEIQLNRIVNHILKDNHPEQYIRNRPIDELARTVLRSLEKSPPPTA